MIFWNLYALVYDTISCLAPYQEMMRDLVRGARPSPGGRILDAGCGTGNLSLELERTCPAAEIVGVDRAEAMLARARRKLCRTSLESANLAEPLGYGDESFDGVVCSNVLYALPRPQETLKELARVLRPAGRISLSNPRSDFEIRRLLARHLKSCRGPGSILRFLLLLPALGLVTLFNLVLLGRTGRREFHYFSEAELRALFSEAGFQDIVIERTYADQDYLVTARRR